jgi:phosphoglycolate phosphatase-like HAD superfamily hydrolase
VTKLIVFDLDGTLAESKAALDDEMAALLGQLLGVAEVAVISGGDWPQFERQLLGRLPADARLARLSLLPTCGTRFYQHAGAAAGAQGEGAAWRLRYSEDFTAAERAQIFAALEVVLPLCPGHRP